MPNHVINEVTFSDIDDEIMDRILANTVSTEGCVDFSILLPLPAHYWPGNVGTTHKAAFPGGQLDAAREIWGTKWNAYGHDQGYVSVVREPRRLTLTFQTAWGPPSGWSCAILNVLKVPFKHSWLSEGGLDGHEWSFDPAALEADLAHEGWTDCVLEGDELRRVHKLLWGVESFDEEGAE